MYFKQVPIVIKKLYRGVTWSSASDDKLLLTFDDGPHPDSTPQLLNLLQELNIKATFFCSGIQGEKHPELIEQIIAHGHQIGSHGYHHLSGWRTDNTDYVADVKKSKNFLKTDLFRPPYGRISPKQVKLIAKELGMKTVLWTHMPGDFDSSISASRLYNNLLSIKSDSIIVLHDKPSCLSKITAALSKLAEKGLIHETLFH